MIGKLISDTGNITDVALVIQVVDETGKKDVQLSPKNVVKTLLLKTSKRRMVFFRFCKFLPNSFKNAIPITFCMTVDLD